MKKQMILVILVLMLALAACGGQEAETPEATEVPAVEAEPTAIPPTEAPPTEEPAAEEATAETGAAMAAEDAASEEAAAVESGSMVESMDHEVDPRLVNITWEWISRDPNGNDVPELVVPNPENYALKFNEDSTFEATLDCNNGGGIYATPSPGSIFMELGPMTRAACAPDSLADDMVNIFGGAVQGYRIEDDGEMLVLIWAAGGPLDYYRSADAEVAGEEEIQGIPADAIQLDLNGLAATYEWRVMPGNPVPAGPGGQGFPPHILLTFDGVSPDEAVLKNLQRMYIFPTDAYVNLYQAEGRQDVANQVIRLGQLISTADSRTELPESPMPLLPPPSSYMDRWAQFQDLNFGVGQGVRYVSDSPYRQQLGAWFNDATGYYYQGLTLDQTFYVSLFWPVSTAALPDTAADATEEQTAAATNPDTNATYQQETKDTLNTLAPAEWSPDLSLLDSMVASLTFPLPGDSSAEADSGEEAGEGEEAGGEEVDLPAPDTGEPTAIVTAPDGIYVRSGPGTEYPDIAVAATGETGKITGASKDGQWWEIEVPASVSDTERGWVSAAWVDAINVDDVPVIDTPEIAEPSLTGINWQWLSTTTPVEAITVNDPTKYTILFNEDGSAAIQADCNNVGAGYTADGSAISITLGPSTLAFCGEESQDQVYLAGLGTAALYFFQDGDLFIDLISDGGTMRFTAGDAAAPAPEPQPTPDPGSPTSPAQGLLFNLVSYGPEGAEQSLIEGTQITATFNDQTVTGTSGCNDYTGQVTPVEDYFTIGPIAMTQKACTEPAGVMEQEQAFLAALQGTSGYQWQQGVEGGAVITGARLLYFLGDGTSGYLNFVAQ